VLLDGDAGKTIVTTVSKSPPPSPPLNPNHQQHHCECGTVCCDGCRAVGFNPITSHPLNIWLSAKFKKMTVERQRQSNHDGD
jgi:hypothetical protein